MCSFAAGHLQCFHVVVVVTHNSSTGKLRLREVYLPVCCINSWTQKADCLRIAAARKSLALARSSIYICWVTAWSLPGKPRVRSNPQIEVSPFPFYPGAWQTFPVIREAHPGQHTVWKSKVRNSFPSCMWMGQDLCHSWDYPSSNSVFLMKCWWEQGNLRGARFTRIKLSELLALVRLLNYWLFLITAIRRHPPSGLTWPIPKEFRGKSSLFRQKFPGGYNVPRKFRVGAGTNASRRSLQVKA